MLSRQKGALLWSIFYKLSRFVLNGFLTLSQNHYYLTSPGISKLPLL
jgi:hypothetical protein